MRRSKWGIALAVVLCLGFGLAAARSAEEAPARQPAVGKKAAAREAAERKREAAAQKQPKRRPVPAAVEVEEVVDNVIFFQNGQAMQANQARAQIRQLYKVELAYADRVCDMSPEQRGQVAAAAVESIDAFVKEFGKNNNNRRVRGRVIINGRPVLGGDMHTSVQAEVKRLVDTHLRLEQAARYFKEVTKREKQFRHATAQFFAARLDEKLSLSAEQRTKLVQALEENWLDQYGQTVEILMHNHQYVPQIAGGPLLPILDDYQKDVWRTLQKLSPQNFGFGMGNGNVMVDDFALPDDKPEAGAEAGPNRLIEGGVDVLIR